MLKNVERERERGTVHCEVVACEREGKKEKRTVIPTVPTVAVLRPTGK